LIPAIPLLLTGFIVRQIRLYLTIEQHTGNIRVQRTWFGIQTKARRHQSTDVLALELKRVGGDRSQRDSDTWYLNLKLSTTSYLLGRYPTRAEALETKQRLSSIIQKRTSPLDAPVQSTHTGVKSVSALNRYRAGLAHLSNSQEEDARRSFQEAMELTDNPLLRRMCEQRIEQLRRT
jgi:hypothetical protein